MPQLPPIFGEYDAAKAAGLLTIGAVLMLALLRKGFHGVSVALGD